MELLFRPIELFRLSGISLAIALLQEGNEVHHLLLTKLRQTAHLGNEFFKLHSHLPPSACHPKSIAPSIANRTSKRLWRHITPHTAQQRPPFAMAAHARTGPSCGPTPPDTVKSALPAFPSKGLLHVHTQGRFRLARLPQRSEEHTSELQSRPH